MKKLLTILLILIGCFFKSQSQTISSMPVYIGNPTGAFAPIVVNGVNRKYDLGKFYNKVDSIVIVGSTLYVYKNGALASTLTVASSETTSTLKAKLGFVTPSSSGYLLNTDFQKFAHAIDSAAIGGAMGLIKSDGSNKLPLSYLPSGAQINKGAWNAATNTPAISDATGQNGWIYTVSDSGTRNLGSGNISFKNGDQVLHNGTTYGKINNGGAVSTVNNYSGAVVLKTSDIDTTTGRRYVSGTEKAKWNGNADTSIVVMNAVASTDSSITFSRGGTSFTVVLKDWRPYTHKDIADSLTGVIKNLASVNDSAFAITRGGTTSNIHLKDWRPYIHKDISDSSKFVTFFSSPGGYKLMRRVNDTLAQVANLFPGANVTFDTAANGDITINVQSSASISTDDSVYAGSDNPVSGNGVYIALSTKLSTSGGNITNNVAINPGNFIVGSSTVDGSYRMSVNNGNRSTFQATSSSSNGGIANFNTSNTPGADDYSLHTIGYSQKGQNLSIAIEGLANGPFTSTSLPGKLKISTVTAGTTALVQRMLIDNQGRIKIGSTAADTSAILDIDSKVSGTTGAKGVLPPRVTRAERLAIANPGNGLVVFQKDGTDGGLYQYKTGIGWDKFYTKSETDSAVASTLTGVSGFGYLTPVQMTSTSLTDTVKPYYIGSLVSSVTAGTSKIPIYAPGYIKTIALNVHVSGTLSSSETGSFYLVINGTGQTLIASGVHMDVAGTTSTIYRNDNLNVYVGITDYMEIKFIQPGLTGSGSSSFWSTKPTSVRIGGGIYTH